MIKSTIFFLVYSNGAYIKNEKIQGKKQQRSTGHVAGIEKQLQSINTFALSYHYAMRFNKRKNTLSPFWEFNGLLIF